MKPTIKEANVEDRSVLASVIRGSFRDVAERFGLTVGNCPTHPSNCTDDWVESAMAKGTRFYLLADGGTPCGCVGLEQAKPEVCYLERLAVLPEFRRRGFGKALVSHAPNQAKQFGAARVGICIIAEHAELKDWYTKLGFLTEKERVTFEHLPFEVTFMCFLIDGVSA